MILLLFVLAFVFTLPANAQLVNQGSIEGIVLDPVNAVIEGAAVRATNLETSAVFTAATDSY